MKSEERMKGIKGILNNISNPLTLYESLSIRASR